MFACRASYDGRCGRFLRCWCRFLRCRLSSSPASPGSTGSESVDGPTEVSPGEGGGIGSCRLPAQGGRAGSPWSTHLARNSSYTHLFFALFGQPPFNVQALTQEFCFESQQMSGACERIQFASSLTRVADELHIGYGVEDCEAYVTVLSLNQTLQLLRPIVTDFASVASD